MNVRHFLLTCLLLHGLFAQAQTGGKTKPLWQQMADSFVKQHPDSLGLEQNKAARWGYEQGLMLKAVERVGQRTGDRRYRDYIVRIIDYSIAPDGTIARYNSDDFNLDNLNTGRILLTLMQQPGLPSSRREAYRQAAQRLHQQLDAQPRTQEGGYWRKKRYPHQMWLDGLYMAEPFSAEYSQLFRQPAGFDNVAKQFALVEKLMVDPNTGLLYHGYDESRQQQWANKTTGQSPNFWARGLGWYAMALVDVLDYFPKNHPQRPVLLQALQRLAPVLVKYQDPATGGWYQVMDQGARAGNYIETSASCMFVYALAKGTRRGYLANSFGPLARKGYDGIVKQFVKTEPNGLLALTGTVSMGGLGGRPYRNGSYEYYLSEPLKTNDFKGLGPFIMAGMEVEQLR